MRKVIEVVYYRPQESAWPLVLGLSAATNRQLNFKILTVGGSHRVSEQASVNRRKRVRMWV